MLLLDCQVSTHPDALQRLCLTIDEHDSTGVFGPLVQHIIGPLAALAVIYALGRLFRRIVVRTMDRRHGDVQVRTLMYNVVTVATIVLAILGALTAAGFPFSVLLTFGGLTSLAIGLAFQDLLRNVLAGIWLLLERPFRIGDVITVGDQTGTVETIQLRTTQLSTGDGKRAILPNLSAFSQTVINSSAFDTRRYAVSLWVPRDAELRRVVAVARRVMRKTAEISQTPEPSVALAVDKDGNWTAECRFWLDYRAHDADEVQAAVAERLQEATGGAAVSAGAPEPDDEPPPPGEAAPPAAVTEALAPPPAPPRQRLRRALRERF
ncbi:MAG: mechanosensitive ion channel family protein [Candidatus Dormibacteria bacterium]